MIYKFFWVWCPHHKFSKMMTIMTPASSWTFFYNHQNHTYRIEVYGYSPVPHSNRVKRSLSKCKLLQNIMHRAKSTSRPLSKHKIRRWIKEGISSTIDPDGQAYPKAIWTNISTVTWVRPDSLILNATAAGHRGHYQSACIAPAQEILYFRKLNGKLCTFCEVGVKF